MYNYTVKLTEEQEQVIQWEGKRLGLNTVELTQHIVDGFLTNLAIQYNDKREVLKRLTLQEIAQIPQVLRDKLGIK